MHTLGTRASHLPADRSLTIFLALINSGGSDLRTRRGVRLCKGVMLGEVRPVSLSTLLQCLSGFVLGCDLTSKITTSVVVADATDDVGHVHKQNQKGDHEDEAQVGMPVHDSSSLIALMRFSIHRS